QCVHGPTLLGLESPTHALRADADPSAQSASATYITLAEDHPYDRHLEIILHLSEPHSPLVILERGRLTFSQYEQQISARRDFIRCLRLVCVCDVQVEFVRKRYHKDVLSNPVLMLNFCPDLLSEPVELQQVSRELIFLIDRSASVTQRMLLAIKSLPHGIMLNIVGFGSIIKPLFASSKPCTDVNYIQKLRVDMGGSNLLGALSWVYRQPVHRSFPRQLFILTDGSSGSVGQMLELVRRNTCNSRCFGLGLGPRACRRLLQGIARVTGGSAEFLCEEERLQPKLIKCLKKALEPALTDVRIDWYVPDNTEALLSPNEIPPLYPGNRMIGYCTLYDVSAFKEKKNEVSCYTVTCVSDCDFNLFLFCMCPPVTDQDYAVSDVRWRMEQASYVQEQYILTRCSLGSERGLASLSPPAESLSLGMDTGSLPQGLERVPPQGRGLSHGLLFPASPLDWDSFTDPEGLFAAAPSSDPQGGPAQCRSVIHGLLGSRPVSWEVSVDLSVLWAPEVPTRGPWDEIIHQLTARSVIRDFENMAEKETDIEHGRNMEAGGVCTVSEHDATTTMLNTCTFVRFGFECLIFTSSNKLFFLSISLFQVRLQLASGVFLLCESFSECIHIPLDRLKRASPYQSHRSSLSPPYRCISPPEGSPEPVGGVPQADSGRGSETDMYEGSPLEGTEPQGEGLAQLDVESSSWATVVALAWLEHHCAGFFVEWELVAAKADFWLKCQSLPEGVDLPGLKAAARQLFLLLRHWDENLQLNMLCYNPNNM
uniref:von Willebrand factor A domain containing 5B2 n=1 Tax=Astyanax mexicanus TaxID=7994 RepID=A0A8B9HDE1_ASTMX